MHTNVIQSSKVILFFIFVLLKISYCIDLHRVAINGYVYYCQVEFDRT